MRRYIAAFGLAVVLMGCAVPMSRASSRGHDDDALGAVRRATAAFEDVDRAVDAGYVQFFGCVHEPLKGSMGIHFVNGALVSDPAIDASLPEAVIYEQKQNGRLALVGVEYVVSKAAWDSNNSARPSLFGQMFNLIPSPNRYGLDAFYELHAWAWKANPAGSHADWNPRVLCPGTEGHVH